MSNNFLIRICCQIFRLASGGSSCEGTSGLKGKLWQFRIDVNTLSWNRCSRMDAHLFGMHSKTSSCVLNLCDTRVRNNGCWLAWETQMIKPVACFFFFFVVVVVVVVHLAIWGSQPQNEVHLASPSMIQSNMVVRASWPSSVKLSRMAPSDRKIQLEWHSVEAIDVVWNPLGISSLAVERQKSLASSLI